MVSGSISEEYKSQIPADSLWKATFCDGHNLVPKLLPGIIASIDILEGDGTGAGTIKKFNFTNAVKECSYVKHRVEVMDQKNHIFKYSIVEGSILGVKVKSYSAEVSLISTNEEGCLAKLKIDYEPIGDSFPSKQDGST